MTRALVVEDDDAVREMAVDILSFADYSDVDTADSRDTAYELIEQGNDYLFLLTDTNLTGNLDRKEGLAVARRFRDRYPKAGILGMSGHDSDDLRTAYKELNAEFMEKPLNVMKVKEYASQFLEDRE